MTLNELLQSINSKIKWYRLCMEKAELQIEVSRCDEMIHDLYELKDKINSMLIEGDCN